MESSTLPTKAFRLPRSFLTSNARTPEVRTTFATIFTARFECMEKAGMSRIGQVQIVDLAGREAESNVPREQTDRLVELSFINRSLFHLSHCIERLTGNKKNLDWYAYRNSKLTMILSHSLRGNSRTAMIATISPSAADVDDTLSTLQLATSVKTVQTRSTVNKVSREDYVRDLETEIARLQGELQRTLSLQTTITPTTATTATTTD